MGHPPSNGNNRQEKKDEKKSDKPDKQSEPGTKKDTSLQGRQDQLNDIEHAQSNQAKTKNPIDSIEKSKQNLKNSLKRVNTLKDAENSK